MFYSILLTLHSLTRWLVIIAAVYAIYLSISGIVKKSVWTKKDDRAGILFASIVDLQLLLGFVLYFFVSPITTAALRDFAGAMLDVVTRFFAVEHSLVMLLGLVLVHVGRTLSKKGDNDLRKHQRAAIWFFIALIVILSAIPWPFMDVGRPLFPFG
ncbi:MAG: hypothetical protein WCG34_07240 [Leptolinea sp.]